MVRVVNLKFKMTPGDYEATTRKIMFRSIVTWVILGIFAMAVIVRSLLWLLTGEPQIDAVLYFIVGCLFPLWWPVLSLRLRRESNLYEEQSWQFMDSGVNLRMRGLSSEVAWSHLNQVMESAKYYLLFINRSIYTIPKHAFANVEQEIAFRNLVKQKTKTNLR